MDNILDEKTITNDELFNIELEKKYLFGMDWIGALNYSLTQSGMPFISNLILNNNSKVALEKIKVEINFNFDFIENYSETFENPLDPGRVLEVSPKLKIDYKKLFELSETINDKMVCKILSDDKVIVEESVDYPILPMNYFVGLNILPESIASFVMPNLPQINRLVRRVSEILKSTTGDSSLTGYQTSDKNRVHQTLAAIYATIYEQNIIYSEIPPSFFVVGQRIRNPQEVIETKMGNCIEMSVLFASLAEACGLNPIIIFIEGHAFSGAWLTDSNFDVNVVSDISELNKRIIDGINDIDLVEATGMNESIGKSYENAVRYAFGTIQNKQKFQCCIDVRRTHYFGIKPMPLKLFENGEIKLVDYGLCDDAEEKAVVSTKIEEYFLDSNEKINVDKATIWMRNLLDLSKRNNLISFRPNAKNIQIFNSNLYKLEDYLSDGEIFEIREVVSDWTGGLNNREIIDVENESELISKISNIEYKSKRIRTFMKKEELYSTLKVIYRDTTKSIEETGSSSLFLALGFLKWTDVISEKNRDESSFRYAPIILLPVELIRKSNTNYQLQLRNEDAQLNITIFEMLRQNFNIQIPGLNPLPQDESGIDINLIFNTIRKKIMNFKGWDVEEVAFLGNFSFSQFVMWNDLKNRFSKLTENKVVKGLVDGRFKNNENNELDIKQIDNIVKTNSYAIPTSTDSSQLLAIIEASNDSSFVLHGPPGTGKSQTITNMISNALYNGKSVLFVAEKMAALNVVYERLSKIGIDPYCLEIHSNKTKKNVVLEKIHGSLEQRVKSDDKEFERVSNRIDALKKELNLNLEKLHEVKESGFSIFELTRFLKDDESNNRFHFENEILDKTNKDKLDDTREVLNNLISLIDGEVKYENHPLKEFTKSIFDFSKKEELRNLITSTQGEIDSFNKELECIDKVEYKNIIEDHTNKELIIKFQEMIDHGKLNIEVTEEIWNKILDDKNLSNLLEFNKILVDSKKESEEILNTYRDEVKTLDITKIKSDFLTAGNSILFKVKKQRQALIPLNSLIKKSVVIIDENSADAEFIKLIDFQQKDKEIKEKYESLSMALNVDRELNSYKLDEKYNAMFEIGEFAKKLGNYLSSNKELSKISAYRSYKLVSELKENKGNLISNLVANLNNIDDNLNKIDEIVGIDVDKILVEKNWNKELYGILDSWKNNIDKWKDWTAYLHIINDLEAMGYITMVNELRNYIENRNGNSKYDVTNITNDFMASMSKTLIFRYISQNDNLKQFNGIAEENKIRELNQFIEQYEELSKIKIKEKLTLNLPMYKKYPEEVENEIIGLKRTIQSKGRGKSLRQIFNDYGRAIKNLTPCMLMSPLSVAQYIDLEFPKFDLVIFDEASQIRTGNAVGAMSRAKNCIIVGDPNQMPPTSFFSSSKLDEENIQIEDLESLLEDCLAINMPQKYLDCHYRSKSESLISFSNKMYYQNNMLTFPSASDRKSMVKSVFVDGTYDRGTTRTNKKEAQYIVNEIITRLKDEKANKSIGVITFNTSQQELIDDLLQEKITKDPELYKIVSSLKESIFIKNLENVQGDERDIILFSIAYGKDETGKFYQNFGPIAKKGGWRRLNVAVSRARCEMIVFHSIKSEDIRLSATSSEGVVGLKKFIEYAEKGNDVLKAQDLKNQKPVSILRNIEQFLEKNGYKCETNVGNSNLNIELAVINPIKENEFIAGIILDSEKFVEIPTARDRNILIPSVLKNLNWNIINIWTIDWLENSSKINEYILSKVNDYVENFKENFVLHETRLDNLEKNEVIDNEEEIPLDKEDTKEKMESVNSNFKDENKILEFEDLKTTRDIINENKDSNTNLNNEDLNKVAIIPNNFEEHSFKKFEGDFKEGVDSNNSEKSVFKELYKAYESEITYDKEIRKYLDKINPLVKEIIKVEAPICQEELLKRISECFSSVRLTKQIKDEILNEIKDIEPIKDINDGKLYYWGDITPNSYNKYRYFSDRYRDLDIVCSEEITNACISIKKSNPGKDNEALIKNVALEFNLTRVTEKNHLKIGYLLELL